jgi:hypothetical protein
MVTDVGVTVMAAAGLLHAIPANEKAQSRIPLRAEKRIFIAASRIDCESV